MKCPSTACTTPIVLAQHQATPLTFEVPEPEPSTSSNGLIHQSRAQARPSTAIMTSPTSIGARMQATRWSSGQQPQVRVLHGAGRRRRTHQRGWKRAALRQIERPAGRVPSISQQADHGSRRSFGITAEGRPSVVRVLAGSSKRLPDLARRSTPRVRHT